MRKWFYISLLALFTLSCKVADTIVDTATELFRGEVVAQAGSHKLHRSQLEQYIPKGVPAQDSINLARQYINAWAEDLLMLDMAEEQLSEAEKDVSKELEDYRRTLLKYRYEQRYINQRLDTLITEEEIGRFYKENPEKFRLERPIVKFRYIIIPADSKSLKTLRHSLSSEDETEVMEATGLAATAAIKYVNSADTWTDLLALAQDMGIDYGRLTPASRGQFLQYTDEGGVLRLVYFTDVLPEGKTAPLEFCTGRIRDLILSSRRHNLESNLEQNLLEDARKNKKFVIY